jgi:hypothetical protein
MIASMRSSWSTPSIPRASISYLSVKYFNRGSSSAAATTSTPSISRRARTRAEACGWVMPRSPTAIGFKVLSPVDFYYQGIGCVWIWLACLAGLVLVFAPWNLNGHLGTDPSSGSSCHQPSHANEARIP